jgi:hypothetical protein
MYSNGTYISSFAVMEGQITSVTADMPRQAADKSTVTPHTIDRNPAIGLNDNSNSFGGFSVGALFLNHDKYWRFKGVLSVGFDLRPSTQLGIEGHVLLADSGAEGGLLGLDLSPSFFMLGNAASLSVKGGWLYLKPKRIVPSRFESRIEYSEPYAGFCVFLGGLGRSEYGRGARAGISLDFLYVRPRTFFSADGEGMRLGDWNLIVKLIYEWRL